MKFPKESVDVVGKFLVRIERLRGELNTYLRGLRSGLGLGEEYQANVDKMEFIKQEKEVKDDDEAASGG